MSAITREQRSAVGNEIAREFRRLDKMLSGIYSDQGRAIWWHRVHPMFDAVPITMLGWGEYDRLEQIVSATVDGAYL